MAWTSTKYNTVFGNKRAIGIKLTADAATQTVETGLDVIEWHSVAFASMATITSLTIAINSSASGVETKGSIGFSGFTSGDELYLTVYGR